MKHPGTFLWQIHDIVVILQDWFMKRSYEAKHLRAQDLENNTPVCQYSCVSFYCFGPVHIHTNINLVLNNLTKPGKLIRTETAPPTIKQVSMFSLFIIFLG